MSTFIVIMALSAVLKVELEPTSPVIQTQTVQQETVIQTKIQNP